MNGWDSSTTHLFIRVSAAVCQSPGGGGVVVVFDSIWVLEVLVYLFPLEAANPDLKSLQFAQFLLLDREVSQKPTLRKALPTESKNPRALRRQAPE